MLCGEILLVVEQIFYFKYPSDSIWLLKMKNSGLSVVAGRVRDLTAAIQPPDATKSAGEVFHISYHVVLTMLNISEIPRRGALDDTISMHLHELPEGSRSYSEENVFHCSNMSPDGKYIMRAKLSM